MMSQVRPIAGLLSAGRSESLAAEDSAADRRALYVLEPQFVQPKDRSRSGAASRRGGRESGRSIMWPSSPGRNRGQQQVEAAARLQPRARLCEQGGDVAVGRAGEPGAVSRSLRLARKRGRARQDDVEQRSRRDGGEQVRRRPRRRGRRRRSGARSRGRRSRQGLMSMATTCAAPARAAASARIPDPVPTSATDLPFSSRPSMKPAKNSLLRKTFGWNTVGGTTRRKPAARASRVPRRVRMKW